jgi:hypothetical protein
MPSRSPLILLLAAAAFPVGGAFGQDVVPLRGEMFVAGRHVVDPPPSEPRNTHAYLTVTGPAALRLYRSLAVRDAEDLCAGGGRRMKRVGTLACSVGRGGREPSCDFGIDLRNGRLAEGRPC